MTSIPTDFGSTPSGLKPTTHTYVALLLFIWFMLVTTLGYSGFFIPDVVGQPPVMLLISGIVTLTAFTLAYRYLGAFRDYVLNLDMRLLIMLHGWRTLGLGFVMLYIIGQLPALFALFAGFGDAIAAVWAIIIAYLLFTRSEGISKKAILRWNHFGLIDFILALSLGVLSQSNGLLQLTESVDSDLMVTFPFVIIPGFLVQILVITHIIIYLQLRKNWKNQDVIKLNQ